MSSNKEKIIAAAEKLEAEGVNPTQVTVREALGGGSFATIGPVLKEWKESKKEDHALTEIQVPEAIIERLGQLQGAVWQAAVDEAERRLSVEREALKVAQEASAAEVAEQLESVATLEAEAEKHDEAMEALTGALEDRSAQFQSVLNELRETKEKAEADRQAAASAQAKVEVSLQATVERAERAEMLHREATGQARSDLTALKAEYKAEIEGVKKEANEQVKQFQAQAQELNKRVDKAEKEARQRGAGEQACQDRLEAASREIEQAQKRVTALEEKTDRAVQEASELRGELRALKDAGQGE